jgi:hypothetical protein
VKCRTTQAEAMPKGSTAAMIPNNTIWFCLLWIFVPRHRTCSARFVMHFADT